MQPRSSKYWTIDINSSNPSRLPTSMPNLSATSALLTCAVGWHGPDRRRPSRTCCASLLSQHTLRSSLPTEQSTTETLRALGLNLIESLRLESRGCRYLYSPSCRKAKPRSYSPRILRGTSPVQEKEV